MKTGFSLISNKVGVRAPTEQSPGRKKEEAQVSKGWMARSECLSFLILRHDKGWLKVYRHRPYTPTTAFTRTPALNMAFERQSQDRIIIIQVLLFNTKIAISEEKVVLNAHT